MDCKTCKNYEADALQTALTALRDEGEGDVYTVVEAQHLEYRWGHSRAVVTMLAGGTLKFYVPSGNVYLDTPFIRLCADVADALTKEVW